MYSIIMMLFFFVVLSLYRVKYLKGTTISSSNLYYMPIAQFLVCMIFFFLAMSVDFEIPKDEVNRFVEENEIIGELSSGVLGLDLSSDEARMYYIVKNLHSKAIYVFIASLIMMLVQIKGTKNFKLNYLVIEGISIVHTLCLFYINYLLIEYWISFLNQMGTIKVMNYLTNESSSPFSSDNIIMFIPSVAIAAFHYSYHYVLTRYYSEPRIENKEKSLDNIIVDRENKSSVSTKEISVYLGIILFVALGLFLIINKEKSSYATIDDNQSKNITITNVYEQRTNAIIQELTSQYGDNIKEEYKYPESSRFCIFSYKGVDDYDFRFIWIYDLEKETIKRIDTQSLFIIRNSEEVFLFSYNLSLDSKNNRLLISGNNGANGIGYTEYVLELDLTNMEIREICSGSSIVKNNDGYVVERRFMTRWADIMAMNEEAHFDVLYNLDGNPVLPPTEGSNIYQLKGFINEIYPITMQLLIKDNKFYGKYYYDKNGSNNFLYLYGGVSESGDIVLLEFTNDGEQTGNFLGRFTNNSFHGTFTNNEKTEMPFLLK